MRDKLFVFALFTLGLLSPAIFPSCAAERLTDRIEIWEGPPLNYGRMSASLGIVSTRDGKIVVIGGSPSEDPFIPHRGKKAIEVAEKSCLLSKKCREQGPLCRCWRTFDLDLPYRLAGQAYLLPDGRVICFSSIFVFNPKSKELDPEPPNDKEPSSGSVAAVIIDLQQKTFRPIYRPIDNLPGNPPLKKGEPIALLQRAFERSIQLRDGRIVRIGGHVLYKTPPPSPKCINNTCHYCSEANQCQPDPKNTACTPKTAEQDCPAQEYKKTFKVLDVIEVYTPPNRKNPLGSVKFIRMPEGRSSVGAIELNDGRVLITGGWGPKGEGPNQDYITTYFLDPDAPPDRALQPGPKALFYREDHSMVKLRDGRILITGGTDQNQITRNTAEFFDTKKGIFEFAPSMTLSREDHIPLPLGPWWIFIGGEDNGKADLIRNTAEIYDAKTGEYIGPIFLFSRPKSGPDKGMAGITDFAAISLTPDIILITGGQQGLQDPDGEYISAGKGSKRTLIIQYRER